MIVRLPPVWKNEGGKTRVRGQIPVETEIKQYIYLPLWVSKM